MPVLVGQDNTVKKRATCRNCGGIHEYMDSEVRNLWSGKDYGGGSDGADGFSCTQCGKDIIIRRW